jgi:hypothetical protein
MDTTQIVSTTIALLALIVSAITAYRTLFSRFAPEIYSRPHLVLSRLNKVPSIIIGCEFNNLGAHAGTIEDIVVRVKFRQQSDPKATRSISTYIFLPTLVRDSYNIFQNYQNTDFEPFQSVPLAARPS